jgi:hypothetical protein
MAAQLRASGSHPQWQNYQQGSTRQKRRGAFCEAEQQSFPPFASPLARARRSRSSPFDDRKRQKARAVAYHPKPKYQNGILTPRLELPEEVEGQPKADVDRRRGPRRLVHSGDRRACRSRHRNRRDLISRRCARGARARHYRPRSAGSSSSRGRLDRQPGHRHSPNSTDSRRGRNNSAEKHKRARLRKRPNSRPQREPITSSSW